jgi:polygalacturonase
MDFLKDVEFPEVELPVFPDRTFDIRDYGAVPGGIESNTKAFRAVMEAAGAAGGGTVVIPPGIWLTGPIGLVSNVNLHAQRGAVVLFSDCREEYPLIETNYEGTERIRALSPIYAVEEENIAITGEGVFDGNGQRWRPVKKTKTTAAQWKELESQGGVIGGADKGKFMWFPEQSGHDGYYAKDILPGEERALERAEAYYKFYRPVMVSLRSCRKILLQGVTFQNSPAWNVHPLFCEHFTMEDVSVRNPWWASNGDGLDLESCRYAKILRCSFDVGDDAICMKSGKNREARKIQIPTEYVTIRDCTVYHGHGGFVAGSEMSRGLRNIRVENCSFLGTDVGIRFKSTLGRGGVVENITFDRIQMVDIPKQAVLFTMAYAGALQTEEADPEDIPEFKNVTLQNITCQGARQAIQVDGLAQLPIHDLYFKDCTFVAEKGIRLQQAERIALENVTLVRKNHLSETYHYEKDVEGDGYLEMFD